jgi:hypothetical protein
LPAFRKQSTKRIGSSRSIVYGSPVVSQVGRGSSSDLRPLPAAYSIVEATARRRIPAMYEWGDIHEPAS